MRRGRRKNTTAVFLLSFFLFPFSYVAKSVTHSFTQPTSRGLWAAAAVASMLVVVAKNEGAADSTHFFLLRTDIKEGKKKKKKKKKLNKLLTFPFEIGYISSYFRIDMDSQRELVDFESRRNKNLKKVSSERDRKRGNISRVRK